MGIGNQTARIDRCAGGETGERGRARGQRVRSEAIGRCGSRIRCRGGQDRMARDRRRQGERMRIVGVAEGQQLGKRPVRKRRQLGFGERCICSGGSANRLRGVVDQDIERPGRQHCIGEPDHLCRVAQVYAHDRESVQPVGGVRQ